MISKYSASNSTSSRKPSSCNVPRSLGRNAPQQVGPVRHRGRETHSVPAPSRTCTSGPPSFSRRGLAGDLHRGSVRKTAIRPPSRRRVHGTRSGEACLGGYTTTQLMDATSSGANAAFGSRTAPSWSVGRESGPSASRRARVPPSPRPLRSSVRSRSGARGRRRSVAHRPPPRLSGTRR